MTSTYCKVDDNSIFSIYIFNKYSRNLKVNKLVFVFLLSINAFLKIQKLVHVLKTIVCSGDNNR